MRDQKLSRSGGVLPVAARCGGASAEGVAKAVSKEADKEVDKEGVVCHESYTGLA
jgi:hypothetical protein